MVKYSVFKQREYQRQPQSFHIPSSILLVKMGHIQKFPHTLSNKYDSSYSQKIDPGKSLVSSSAEAAHFVQGHASFPGSRYSLTG